MLQNLDSAQFESHVVTTYDEFRHYEAEVRQLQIPIYSLGHGELRVVNRMRSIVRYIRLMWLLQPNIVHGWLHYPNLIARIARPFCPPHSLITAVRAQYSPCTLRSERITEKLSDFRIVINDNSDFGIRSTQHRPITLAIANAISSEFFAETSAIKIAPSSSFDLLMVARIDSRKDHQTLLEALHILGTDLLSQIKVTLIGEVTDKQIQQQINNTITRYDLETTVQQLPPTNNILPYYRATDISVLPSHSEAFPNVLLESMAAGKPVIVSEAANKAGLIQHEINGWIFPTRDSEALANCIKAALVTPYNQREVMGNRGRAIASQYTIEKMVLQYQQLYKRAVKQL